MKSPIQRGNGNGAHLPNVSTSVVTPTGGYKVTGTINGHATALLVDTGAAVTLVRKDVWDQINKGRGVKLKPWEERQLVSVDGSPLHVYGSVPVDLSLAGALYQADIVVVSPLNTEAILGLDFLRKHKVTVDMESLNFT